MLRTLVRCVPLTWLSCAAPTATMPPTPPPQPEAHRSRQRDTSEEEDPYLWLEEVTGEKALAWVKAQNERSLKELGTPDQAALKDRLLAIYDSKDKIPYVSKRGKYLYNFWRDEKNVRGLWRRTTLDQYRRKQPRWETLLDIDALAKQENENWLYAGTTCLRPEVRALPAVAVARRRRRRGRPRVRHPHEGVRQGRLLPARGQVVGRLAGRGHDLRRHRLRPRLAHQLGLPAHRQAVEAGHAAGRGEDAVRGPGQRRRGQRRARLVPGAAPRPGRAGHRLLRERDPLPARPEGGPLVKLDRPDDAIVSYFRDFLLLQLRSDWEVAGKTFPAGALLAANLKDYRAGKRELEMLYEPGKNHSLSGYSGTQERAAAQRARGRSHPGAGGDPRQGQVEHPRAAGAGAGQLQRLRVRRRRGRPLLVRDRRLPRAVQRRARRPAHRQARTPQVRAGVLQRRRPRDQAVLHDVARTARASPTSRSPARTCRWTAATRCC